MYQIERRIAVGGKRKKTLHNVYTVEEADEQGIAYGKHGDVEAVGDWVVTDDGFVGQVLKIQGPYGRRKGAAPSNYELTLSFCRVWKRKKALNFLPFWEAQRFSKHTTKSRTQLESQRRAWKKVAKKYAWLKVTQAGVVEKAQLEALAKEYRPKDNLPMASFMFMFKSKSGKKVIKEALKDILSEAGITPEVVLQQQMDIIEEAREEKQLSVAEKANGRLIDMLDLMPDKAPEQKSLQGGVVFSHLAAKETPHKQIPLTEVQINED